MALMRLSEARPVPLLSPGLVKMEERKRPASYEHEDSAPPLKKQATSVNGSSKAHPDSDMPWKDELEVSLAFNLPPTFATFSTPTTGLPLWTTSLVLTHLCPRCSGFRKMQSGDRCKNTSESETL